MPRSPLSPPRAIIFLLAAVALLTAPFASALPVFPGAVGHGTATAAGRGGQVVRVTNLLDDYQNPPEGSFRWAVERVSGPRTIVFEVAGVIELKRYVVFRRDDSGTHGSVTVAGQTAPWPGITLKNAGLIIHARNVLVQHIAIRPGTLTRNATGWDLPTLDNRDAIAIECPSGWSVNNVVIDHVSCSWATDEMVSVWGSDGPVSNVTFSENIFAHPILNGGHSKGAHGFGPLMGKNGSNTSVLRNLMAFNWERNPLIRAETNGSQVVNNFIYRPGKWAHQVFYLGSSTALNGHPVINSIVGNLVRKHPVPFSVHFGRDDGTIPIDTHPTTGFGTVYVHNDTAPGTQLYLADNKVFDPATQTWGPADGNQYHTAFFRDSPSRPVVRLDTDPYANSGGTPWTPWPVDEVESRVLTRAGKFPAQRDPIDAALAQKVATNTGTFAAFETDLGDDPWGPSNIQVRRPLTLPADPNADSGDGYTHLEKWLHAFSAHVEGTGPAFPAPQTGAPTIVTTPLDRSVEETKTVTLLVAATGTGPLTYQWFKDNVPLADDARLSGATAASLTIRAAQPSDAGTYRAVVTNSLGEAATAPVTLAITPATPPALSAPFANRTFEVGQNVPLAVKVTGTTPITYRWTKDGADVAPSNRIFGTTHPTLSILSATAADAGTYTLHLTNAAGSTTATATLSLAVPPEPPPAPVVGEPSNITTSSFVANWSASLGATGYRLDVSTSPTFATFVSGYNNLSVGTAQSRNVVGLATNTTYYYRARATNGSGTSASSAVVPVTTSVSGGYGATTIADEDFSSGRTGWFNLNNTTAANLTVVDGQLRSLPNVTLAGYFAPVSLQLGESLELAYDLQLESPLNLSSGVRFGLYNSQGQRATADGSASALLPVYTGNMVSFNPQPSSGNFIAIRRRVASPTSNNLMASTSASFYGQPIGTRGVYQSATLSRMQNGLIYRSTLKITRTGPAEITLDFALTGNGLGTGFSASAVIGDLTAAETTFDTFASMMPSGAATAMRVDNVLVTHFVPDPRQPPAITTQPASQTVVAFQDASFTVAATGLPAPTYQWRHNGTPIPGATSATLTIPDAQATDAGTYDVVVTNEVGNQTSTTATLTIQKAPATVTLASLSLNQSYDGTARAATVTTAPANLPLVVTYNGSTTPPTLPGAYLIEATISDSNYAGSISGTLVIATTALVRHAPTLNGALDGSAQILLPENITLNGTAWLSGDLLVPGSPTLHLNGNPTHAGSLSATGASAPTNHTVTLNGGSVLRYLVTRVDPLPLDPIPAPPAPTGTRNVNLNTPSDSPGDFATLRNLTLNANAGLVAIPPGTYGAFTANGDAGFILGTAPSPGAPESLAPAVYNLERLTLNATARLVVVGPVILTLADHLTANHEVGDAGHPEWLVLNLSAGSVTLNGPATLSAHVSAPSGTVTLNGHSTLIGRVRADRLLINGNGLLRE